MHCLIACLLAYFVFEYYYYYCYCYIYIIINIIIMTKSSSATATATSTTTTTTMTSSSSSPSLGDHQQAVVAATKTPPRHAYVSHNTHTPIASIKRPRSSLERRTPHNTQNNVNSNSAARHAHHHTTSSSSDNNANNSNNNSTESPVSMEDDQDDEGDDVVHPKDNNDDSFLAAATPDQRNSTNNMDNNASGTIDTCTLSPLHPPRPVLSREEPTANVGAKGWVGAKVDALFSPVLHFLNHDATTASDEEDDHPCDEMDGPTTASSTSATTTPTGSGTHTTLGGTSSMDSEEHHPANTNATTTTCCIRDDDSTGSLQAVEDLDDDFNPWQFIKALPPYNLVRLHTPPVALPPKAASAPPITLVLDLDETLVHCSVEEPASCDLTFGVEFHGIDYQVYVKLRPHLQRFLQAVSQDFEVVVFTASQPVYANELLNRIDPNSSLVHYRLFRESCLQVEGNFLKDLTVLGRDLSQTVLVDNSPHAFGYQLDNGIPIESWFDDPQDRELLKLERFLRRLHGADDVRPLIRRKFENAKRVAEAPDYAQVPPLYQQQQQQQQYVGSNPEDGNEETVGAGH